MFIKSSLISFCLLALVACGGKKQSSKKDAPPPVVDVQIAGSQKVSSTLEVNGSIVANEFAELHPEVSGKIIFLNVPEGKSVAQGTIIARVNDADLQANLKKQQSQLALAQQTEARLKKLLQVEGINQADYDAALNQVNSLQADIDFSKALIEKTIIKAPFSGLIGLRNISKGAYVTPATLVTTMQQIDRVKVDFSIPQAYSDYIQTGAIVTVQADINQKNKQKAQIIAKEAQLDATTRNLKVRALLSGAIINPGSFVKVYIDINTHKHSILMPANAIIPDAMSKKMIVVKNGKAVFVKVETGLRRENTIEITQGLAEGDSVVVTGVLFAKPDAPVKVRNVKSL